MKLNDRTYDVLKWLTLVGLPACGSLWTMLAKIWPAVPYAEQIPATILAICTFLGLILGISTAGYYQNQAAAAGKHEAQTVAPKTADQYETAAAAEGGTATLEEIIADLKDLE